MNSRILARYAVLYTVLFTLVVSGALVTVSLLAFNEAQSLQVQLQEAWNTGQPENQQFPMQDLDGYWSTFSRSLLYVAALTVVVILLLGLLIGRRLSKALSHPLGIINEAAWQFAQGNLSYQLPTELVGEFGELAVSLNQMANNLRRSNEVLDKAQEIAGVGSWEWHTNSRQLLWSDYVYQLFGADRETLQPTLHNLIQYVKPADQERVRNLFRYNTLSAPFEAEFTVQRTDGSERTLHLHGEPVSDASGAVIGALGTLQDVTERRQAEQKLAYLANYDTLTYLPNRYLFQDRLKHAMQRADREGTQVALLFLDLDHFKSVNDALGHGAGDELLKLAATRLLGAVRSSDTVARLGGDEFTIILEHVVQVSSVAAVAEKVLDRLTSSFTLGSREIFISASIGVTLYPSDAKDSNALLKNADTAMYRAKAQGRNSYFFYTADLNQQTQERLALENSLRGAFARNEFMLYFQPQIYLESGKLVGVEVLLRWHSQDPSITPDRFIPVLEDTGLIIPVGEWVLEQACAQLQDWRPHGLRELRVSVNFSARQIHQREFLTLLQTTLEKTNLPAEFFEVEITESTLLDTAASTEVLNRLQDIGVRLAIDDFGTGYSSLTYLKQFYVDTLKIDGSFVRDIAIDADDAAITSAIIGLSQSLGIEVIAEGVETADQIEFLRHHGCKLVQGYYVSEPLPADDFLRWVKEQCVEEEGYYYWQGMLE